jgi:hypothetical protein
VLVKALGVLPWDIGLLMSSVTTKPNLILVESLNLKVPYMILIFIGGSFFVVAFVIRLPSK